ncbi:hypothetical protein NL676_015912 [Syzygium grande]|nr:hypothetical protein NL676_015912 [Syzygium grande]
MLARDRPLVARPPLAVTHLSLAPPSCRRLTYPAHVKAAAFRLSRRLVFRHSLSISPFDRFAVHLRHLISPSSHLHCPAAPLVATTALLLFFFFLPAASLVWTLPGVASSSSHAPADFGRRPGSIHYHPAPSDLARLLT